MTRRIVIVGAGQAGLQAAATLRQKGFDGTITIVGEETHAPYERPPLSKAMLKGAMDADRLAFRKPAFYRDKAIDLRLTTRALAIDPAARTVTLAGGDRLDYDKLLLATGARVRHLDCPGADLAGIHTLHTIEDSLAIRKTLTPGARLAVVGGGYIGLEVAAAAAQAGCSVTVLEAAERPMVRTVSAPISAHFQDLHTRHGVTFKLTAQVTGFNGDGRVAAVTLADGAPVACDAAVVGIGVAPDTALAADAGLDCKDAVWVDDTARTSDPDIYAAGDCTRFLYHRGNHSLRLESVQNAVDQAKTAALAMLGQPTAYDAVPWFWSDQYDAKLQIAGIFIDGVDQAVVRGDPAGGGFSVAHLRDGRLAAIETVNALKDFTQGKKLIADGRAVDPAALADPTVALKDL